MQQDFFDFDDFEPPQLRVQKKRHRGRLFTILGILIAVLAGLGTVLGIFRSNDTYLAKDLRKTFSIQPPPAPEPPKTQSLAPRPAGDHPQPAAAERPVPPPVATTGHAAKIGALPGQRTLSPKPAGNAPQKEIQTTAKALASRPSHPQIAESTSNRPLPPAAKTPLPVAAPARKPAAPAVAEKKEGKGKTATAKTHALEAGRHKPSAKPVQPQPAVLAKRGELAAAAGQYRKLLLRHPSKYSISLEVACHRETVMRALKHAGSGAEMFILPKKIAGKSCFAVLWGRYDSIAAAKKGRAAVPSFFRSAPSPPRIIALHPMLR